MVDNLKPTNQFHPYQPPDATPRTEVNSDRLRGIFNKAGLGNMNVRGSVEKARGIARNNPGAVLGGLAALVIGAGLMRKRGMR